MIIDGIRAGQWVADRAAGGVFSPELQTAIADQRKGRILAGLIFENWNMRSIVVHLAAEGRLTRNLLWFASYYAFVQLGVYKMIAPVNDDNHRMTGMLRKMGFREECRISEAQPNGDVLIFTLTRQNCRFLEERYRGKTVTPQVA